MSMRYVEFVAEMRCSACGAWVIGGGYRPSQAEDNAAENLRGHWELHEGPQHAGSDALLKVERRLFVQVKDAVKP